MAFRNKSKTREVQRVRRHSRVRRRVIGSAERPRLVVHRSIKNIQGQITDDTSGKVLLGVSTLTPEVRALRGGEGGSKKALSKAAGKLLAEKAKAAGINKVVAAFAEGAREGGLEF
jgi:large subunit ribosomal protein L18